MQRFLYQLSYTPESIAAQIKDPEDRLMAAAKPVVEAMGGELIGGGFSFGEFDVAFLFDVPDDESAAAISTAVVAGGAVKAVKITKLLTGEQWIKALQKASHVVSVYRPRK